MFDIQNWIRKMEKGNRENVDAFRSGRISTFFIINMFRFASNIENVSAEEYYVIFSSSTFLNIRSISKFLIRIFYVLCSQHILM